MPDRSQSAWPTDPPLARADLGTVAIEYALLASLVAMAIFGSLVLLGNTLAELPLSNITNAIQAVLD